jgi:two-component system chemotaxis sensor kinase CheA
MKSREQEYREIFMAEALEYYDAMSRHISELERNPQDQPSLNELFRLMHNLKSNSRAMGFTEIGEVAHHMETIFGLIRDKQRDFAGSLSKVLFSGVDTIGAMIRAVGEEAALPDVTMLLDNLNRLVEGQEPELPEEDLSDEEANRKLELSDLVYIQIKKLDNLLNLVGELVIDRDRILTLAQELGNPALQATAQHLFRISDDLQYSVMDARLVGVGVLLNKFPRVVRDVATAEHKEVELALSGQDVQINNIAVSANGEITATDGGHTLNLRKDQQGKLITDNRIRIWDAKGKLLRTLNEPMVNTAAELALSPDGALAAGGSGQIKGTGDVKVWNTQTGKLLWTAR